MHFVRERLQQSSTSTVDYVSRLRAMFSTFVQNLRSKFGSTQAATSEESIAETTPYVPPSICASYAAEYNGSTCLGRTCCTSCYFVRNCTCSMVDCTKSTVGCFINILCYPFIPCAVALLPKTCQTAEYPNTNTLHCCYGGTACQSGQNGSARLCCNYCYTQTCCLIWVSLLITVIFLFLWSFTQDSLILIEILIFLNELDQITLLFFFVVLFTMVSFPMLWGYFILNLAAGYLYGFLPGIPVVVVSVTVGIATAHFICKKYFSNWVLEILRRRANYDQIEAILQVIDGSAGLKVIALTRLTPIPFGFQNGLFAVSNVNMRYYLLASNIGLLPTQVLNCYIGSTFRSMQEILDQENPGGFLFFLAQIAVGICLMLFVLRQARKELATALQNSKNTKFINDLEETAESSLLEVKVTQPLSSSLQNVIEA